VRNYQPAGTLLALACSCKAEVVVSLAPMGVHCHYVIYIRERGARCRHGQHRRGARRLAAQRRRGGRTVVTDIE